MTYVYQMAEEDGVPVLKTRTQRGGGEWEERDCKLDGVRREDVDRKGKPGWVREPPAPSCSWPPVLPEASPPADEVLRRRAGPRRPGDGQ